MTKDRGALAADALHSEDQLPCVEHAPQESHDRDPGDDKERRWLADRDAYRSRYRAREECEPCNELDHRDAAIKTHAGRSQAASRSRREGNAGTDVESDQLESECPERLRHEREESEAERDDVAEKDRPRHRTELGVALIGQRADVDRERDKEKSKESGRRGHQRHVEVVPEDELLGHQRIPSTFRAIVRSDAVLSGARSRRACFSSARIARSACRSSSSAARTSWVEESRSIGPSRPRPSDFASAAARRRARSRRSSSWSNGRR